MRLNELIKTIERVASQQPSIRMIVRSDVFRINSAPSLRYGIFAWTQGQHTGNVNGMQTYNFTIFYVDRLLEDASNTIECQSVGCETMGNILRTLSEEYDIEIGDYTIQPFNQRFTDECAGVYCSVSFSVLPTSVCSESYDDIETDNIIF